MDTRFRHFPKNCSLWFALLLGGFTLFHPTSPGLHTIEVNSPQELQEFFRYTQDRIPFISAHRGGAREGYPENCIATFENTLRHTHAILEIDPRLTKDSVIILMHDPTLDRTTNGTGRVEDHTWEELQQLKLKDPEGKLTEHRIPTLDEALEWARGKTILVLDKKSVPPAVTAQKIRELQAETHAMIIAYDFEEAKRYHQWNENIMMEVFIPNEQKLEAFEQTGVPWKNVVAFIAHARPEDKTLYDKIHAKGVMCMVGSSRIYDQEYLSGKTQVYEEMIREGVDIIEADLALEAGQAIKPLVPQLSSKAGYFKKSISD